MHTNLMNSVHHECINDKNKTKQNELIFVVSSPLSRWSINKIISLDWKSWWFLSRNQPTVDRFLFQYNMDRFKKKTTRYILINKSWKMTQHFLVILRENIGHVIPFSSSSSSYLVVLCLSRR